VDLAAIIADATAAVSLARVAVQTATDAAPFIELAWDILVNKTTLTDAQRAAMATQEAALRAQLDAPTIAGDAP
jgi:hypothetical protein